MPFRSSSSCSRSRCAAAALAKPSVKLSQPDQNATIMLLVDVSGSMRANDVEPTRLDAAVAAMRTFLDRLPSRFKVGLVAFSSEPEPLVAPTSNRDVLRQSIALLEPEAGTAVGDGIGVAVQMLRSSLRQAGYVRKPGQPVPAAIVLLSDGAQNRGILQPVEAARMSKAAGIRIYPVSLGTPQGKVTFGFGAFMNSVPVPPDPYTMSQIATVTGGKAYTAQHRLERRPDLQDARLEHRPHPQARPDHELVRGCRGRAARGRGRSRGAVREPRAVGPSGPPETWPRYGSVTWPSAGTPSRTYDALSRHISNPPGPYGQEGRHAYVTEPGTGLAPRARSGGH